MYTSPTVNALKEPILPVTQQLGNPPALVKPAKKKSKTDKIPVYVRVLIYSFIPLNLLRDKMSKISSKDRNLLLISKNLDQSRHLLIRMGKYTNNPPSFNQLSYAIQLATRVTIRMLYLQTQSHAKYAQSIFDQISNHSKQIELQLCIDSNFNVEFFNNLINQESSQRFVLTREFGLQLVCPVERISFEIWDHTCQAKIAQVLKMLNIQKQVEINFDGKPIDSRQFDINSEDVDQVHHLILKSLKGSIRLLTRSFLNIRKLEFHCFDGEHAEMLSHNIDLKSLEHLQEFKLSVIRPDSDITDSSIDFKVIFFDPQQIKMTLYFQLSSLSLRNIIKESNLFDVKDLTFEIEELEIKINSIKDEDLISLIESENGIIPQEVQFDTFDKFLQKRLIDQGSSSKHEFVSLQSNNINGQKQFTLKFKHLNKPENYLTIITSKIIIAGSD